MYPFPEERRSYRPLKSPGLLLDRFDLLTDRSLHRRRASFTRRIWLPRNTVFQLFPKRVLNVFFGSRDGFEPFSPTSRTGAPGTA